MTTHNKSCYCTGSSNSEGICQHNDSIVKDYSCLEEEHGMVNGRAQLLKLAEYDSEKENSLYPVMFVITCLSLSLGYNHHSESGMHVIPVFATLIS